MTQLIVTLEDNTAASGIKKAIRLLKGVAQVRERKTLSKKEISTSYEPNAETLEAIRECRAGNYAGTVDTSCIDAMIKSILE